MFFGLFETNRNRSILEKQKEYQNKRHDTFEYLQEHSKMATTDMLIDMGIQSQTNDRMIVIMKNGDRWYYYYETDLYHDIAPEDMPNF